MQDIDNIRSANIVEWFVKTFERLLFAPTFLTRTDSDFGYIGSILVIHEKLFSKSTSCQFNTENWIIFLNALGINPTTWGTGLMVSHHTLEEKHQRFNFSFGISVETTLPYFSANIHICHLGLRKWTTQAFFHFSFIQ